MKALLPDLQRLLELRDAGMSYPEIVDWIEEHEGVRVSRHSVASKISRAGESTPRPRYERHLPWRVKAEHGQNYHAKMLRLLGRRDLGLPITDEQENKRLIPWLNKLKLNHSVVVYDERTPAGFYLIDGAPNEDGIPINADYRFPANLLKQLEARDAKVAHFAYPLCERRRGQGRIHSL